MNAEKALTAAVVARILTSWGVRCHRDTVRRWWKRDQMPYAVVNGRMRMSSAQLRGWYEVRFGRVPPCIAA